MTDDTAAQQDAAHTEESSEAEERLLGLLRDLATLQTYLSERGRHTYLLAQKFLENSRREPSSRAYDERQATMLEYQHYIWHEIAGRVGQLLTTYGGEAFAEEAEGEEPGQP